MTDIPIPFIPCYLDKIRKFLYCPGVPECINEKKGTEVYDCYQKALLALEILYNMFQETPPKFVKNYRKSRSCPGSLPVECHKDCPEG